MYQLSVYVFAPLSQSVRFVCAPVWGGSMVCVCIVSPHLYLSVLGVRAVWSVCAPPLRGSVMCPMHMSASLGESLRIVYAPVYGGVWFVCVCYVAPFYLSVYKMCGQPFH